MTSSYDGFFLTLEGVDGSGKTTLSKGLADRVGEDRSVIYTREFPRSYLDGYLHRLMEERPFLELHESIPTPIAQTLVIAGAHSYKYETLIRPALEQGAFVIADRYAGSLVAYQSLILERAGEDPQLASIIADYLPKPDVSIFLPIDREEQTRRLGGRGTPLRDDEITFLEDVQRRMVGAMAPDTITYEQEGSVKENINKLYKLIGEYV